MRRVSLGPGLGLAALWGIVSGYGIAEPFPPSISAYFEQPAWMGWVFAIGLFAAMASPYYMLFAALDRGLGRWRGHWSHPLSVAGAWIAVEWLRGRLFTETVFFIGNPWGQLGASQLAALPVVQIAEWTGLYGPSFLVALVNAAIASEIDPRRGDGRTRARWTGRVALPVVPVVASALYGAWLLPPEDAAPPGSVAVAAVQPNLELGVRWKREYYGKNLDRHLRQSVEVARASRPPVIFWPEGSFTFFLEEEPAYRRAIARTLTALDAELVAGGPAREVTEGGTHFRNRVFVLSPDGAVRGRYDKEHLVPFSEYVPGRAPDPMRRDFGGTRAFVHGVRTAPLPSRAGRIGVLVCNEALLSEVAARRVRDGAQVLANPSNDSWVAEEDFARRMLEHVAFRSIELRRWQVRASTEGPSAVIDPWGRITASTAHGEPGTLLAAVVPRDDLTGYARFGDWFPALCCIGTLAGLFPGLRRA